MMGRTDEKWACRTAALVPQDAVSARSVHLHVPYAQALSGQNGKGSLTPGKRGNRTTKNGPKVTSPVT